MQHGDRVCTTAENMQSEASLQLQAVGWVFSGFNIMWAVMVGSLSSPFVFNTK